MRHFCTIFDRNYLFQGMTVYRSLEMYYQAHEFTFYVLCMDSLAFETLQALGRPNIIPIHVDTLNSRETLPIRQQTTRGQYCWVCQPLICEYLLNTYGMDMVTYLEADSMFFGSPECIFEEIGEGSVSLVPHRFTPKYDLTSLSGVYCVQFNAFRNDQRARTALTDWKMHCFRYTKKRPKYYPGQLVLNTWPQKHEGVVVVQQLGAGLAPWNIQQYELHKQQGQIYVNGDPLVFYHYHQFAFYEDGDIELGYYPLTQQQIDWIYKPYLEALRATQEWVQSVNPDFHYKKVRSKPPGLFQLMLAPSKTNIKDFARKYVRQMEGRYNVFERL